MQADNDDSFEPAFIEQVAKIPPLKVMMSLLMVSISILFLVLLLVFSKSDPAGRLAGQHFPKFFLLSTAFLLLCSWLLEQARKAFRAEDHARLQQFLLFTLAGSIGFCISQVLGWQQLWETGIGIRNERSGAALYIISGVHVAHLLGGMIFLFLTLFRIGGLGGDAVAALLYFSNPNQELKLAMLARYWHFLDLIWLVLFFYFLWFFL